jgi:hypothetical protein
MLRRLSYKADYCIRKKYFLLSKDCLFVARFQSTYGVMKKNVAESLVKSIPVGSAL